MKLKEIIDALLFAACIGAPFAAFFYFYGAETMFFIRDCYEQIIGNPKG